MAAYLIGTLRVTDPSWLAEYTEKVVPMLKSVGATYVVRSMKTEVLESEMSPPTASIIIEFPSMEIARDWYKSEAYQALVKLRQTGSTIELFLAEGV